MKQKILIVDDQAGIRLLLTDIFTGEGYDVAVAETGKEAIEKIYAEEFDLVILDYHLPILNGEEVLHQMKLGRVMVPVILMTGSVEGLDKQLVNNINIVDIIAKPFDITEICQLVRLVLLKENIS